MAFDNILPQKSIAHHWYSMHGRVDWWSFGILIYELLYGFTPFRGKKRDETFNNILKRPLSFPDQPEVSEQCKVLPNGSCTSEAPYACCRTSLGHSDV